MSRFTIAIDDQGDVGVFDRRTGQVAPFSDVATALRVAKRCEDRADCFDVYDTHSAGRGEPMEMFDRKAGKA
jgi:hypothetical protein